MIKTYKLRFLNFVAIPFSLSNGKEVIVTFNGAGNSKGIFTTDSEELQSVLENAKEFNDLYELEKGSIIDETPAQEEEQTNVEETAKLEVKSVKNLQEANAFIKERFGEENSFRSSSNAVDFCKENGVELIFEK